MISITTPETSSLDPVVLYEKATTDFQESAPRASRVATLDGGAEIISGGVCEGDRIFKVYSEITESESLTLWNIYRIGSTVHFACKEGFFLGIISNVKTDRGDLSLTFLVKERLST